MAEADPKPCSCENCIRRPVCEHSARVVVEVDRVVPEGISPEKIDDLCRSVVVPLAEACRFFVDQARLRKDKPVKTE